MADTIWPLKLMGFLRRQTTLAELVLQNFIFTNCNPTPELPFQDNFRLFVTKISFYVVIAESFLLQKASTFWKKKSLREGGKAARSFARKAGSDEIPADTVNKYPVWPLL